MCACGPFPQIKTLSPLAIMYNDISVLENHHAATTYRSGFCHPNPYRASAMRERTLAAQA